MDTYLPLATATFEPICNDSRIANIITESKFHYQRICRN